MADLKSGAKAVKTLFERIDASIIARNSLVCVGLDPDPARMAIPDVLQFNKEIVDATKHAAAAYKLQFAFYEALGLLGIKAMSDTVKYVQDTAPGTVIIADCKRADIGPVAAAYARSMFEVWGFDAATVVAYMGADTVEPWLQYPDRGIYVVCRSSNAGAKDLQDLRVRQGEHERRVFEWVADASSRWGMAGQNVGIVVGATYPDEMTTLRRTHPSLPFLIPGVGAQGGDADAASRAAANADRRGFIINSSRGIIYASKNPAHFARAAREECEKLREQINAALGSIGTRKA
ncbi:MAG: orotidine-5'-phosphate decarboxylase [Dehalococcoidia bacterium]|nr:orotidine-5'-phosphate decarboxylase [Dehalococcoidia bacterium]